MSRPGGAQGPDPDTIAAPAPPPPQPDVHRGALTSAVSALLLLASMFLTKWYGVAGVVDPSAARPARSGAENAWNGLSVVRWVMLVTILVALGSVALRASQRRHGTKTDASRLVAGLGSLTAALLAYRVLIVLPGSAEVIDQKLGALLGLLCAIGVALGGYESMLEQRLRARTTTKPTRRRSRVV